MQKENPFFEFGQDWWFWVLLPLTLPIWAVGWLWDAVS